MGSAYVSRMETGQTCRARAAFGQRPFQLSSWDLVKAFNGWLLTAGYLQDGTAEHILGILELNRRAVQMRLCGKLFHQLIAHHIEDIEKADDNVVIEGGIQLLAT